VHNPGLPTTGVSVTDLEAILRQYWGYTAFRPLQQEAMAAILAGRDSLLVLPTGGGKSLCFQAPALVRNGLALVVSPLISLMKDQVDALQANGVPAACFNSALPSDQRQQVLAGIRSARYRLLYVSPERLVGEGGQAFVEMLRAAGVSFCAIDEAHCISHWGHDFRPEYRQLAALRHAFPGASIHAFTATATVRVRQDIVRQLGLVEPEVLVGSFDRPNLIYRVRTRQGLRKQIEDVVRRHPGEGGIVYCLSRREVEELAAWLSKAGHRALPYHAGLPDDVRHSSQEAFLTERTDIIVATVAFGMGIDRSNVRYVIHAGAPRSLEHYQQEAGRAGRDGLEAECVLVYAPADFLKWRRMLEANGELSESAVAQLRAMDRYAASTSCRHRALVEHFGQRFDRDDCGACDWCLRELERVEEPVVLARKILSCVARVGQRWGIGHVTDVLAGRTTEAVVARGHERLTTFGLLKGCPAAELRGYVEQLLTQGLLERAGEEYPVLVLTEPGVRLLKVAAHDGVALWRQRRPERTDGRRRTATHPPEGEAWEGVDRALFERLRDLRLEIARVRGVPPYVVFHDTSLRDMARRRPATVEQMREVYGVGVRKAQDLGPGFLEAIRRFAEER
jgi:ATP-dependent DNA helicase RecQ